MQKTYFSIHIRFINQFFSHLKSFHTSTSQLLKHIVNEHKYSGYTITHSSACTREKINKFNWHNGARFIHLLKAIQTTKRTGLSTFFSLQLRLVHAKVAYAYFPYIQVGHTRNSKQCFSDLGLLLLKRYITHKPVMLRWFPVIQVLLPVRQSVIAPDKSCIRQMVI